MRSGDCFLSCKLGCSCSLSSLFVVSLSCHALSDLDFEPLTIVFIVLPFLRSIVFDQPSIAFAYLESVKSEFADVFSLNLEILDSYVFLDGAFEMELRLTVPTVLIGFSGEIIWPLRQLSLLVKIRDEEHSTSAWIKFLIVRSSSPYNGIIGRPGVRKIQAVPSIAHGMLKYPVAGGILTLKSSKIIPIECATVSRPEGQPSAVNQAVKEIIKVAINPEYPEQTIMIGSTPMKEGRNKLCNLL
ncbi:hypothetical protein Tco_0167713 [Tanacetum coccineum]